MNLTQYSSIKSAIFVKLTVDYYRTTSTGPYTSQLLCFSDFYKPYQVNGDMYTGLGSLMNITSTSSDLQATSGDLTITLSGIPTTAIAEINNSKIKGSPIQIYRVIFDTQTNQQIDQPIGRYKGYVNNFSFQEEYDTETKESSITIVITCSNNFSVLSNKIAGRKTNPSSQQRFFPNDISMNRIPNLKNTEFNFGGPTK